LRNKGRFFVLSIVNVGREEHSMNKIAFVALGCLVLGACATPTQTVGTAGGVVAGAAVGGPVGAVVGGAVGAVATRPGSVLGGGRYRCHYRDGYGHVHYHWCHA
jgi:osmotically inducible lipoprotein OsmB